MSIIYLATNKINGKQYVGQTRNELPDRKKTHKCDALKRGKTVFHKAIRKYGFDSFEWGIVLECPHNWLDVMEKFCIEAINTKRPNGYNSTDGGCGPKGQFMSKETRDKMSRARKGHIVTQETRDKISAGHLGKKKKNGPACRARMIRNPPSKEIIKKMHDGWARTFKEHPERFARGATNGKSKKVKCLETGAVFDTLASAAIWCNGSSQAIGRVCLGKKKHTRGYSWEYV